MRLALGSVISKLIRLLHTVNTALLFNWFVSRTLEDRYISLEDILLTN